jgi:hypothetical protein
MGSPIVAGALGAALIFAAAPAAAAPVVIFGEDLTPASGAPADTPNSRAARAAFDAVFGGNVFVEDFESYPPGGQLPDVPPFAIPTASFRQGPATVVARFDQAGAVTASPLATSAGQTYGDDEDWLTVGLFSPPPAGPIGSLPPTGFGLFGIGLDAPLTITVDFTDGTSQAFAVGQTLLPRAIFFWGVYDPTRAIESVTGGMPLNVGQGFYLMDDLVIGYPRLPAPASAALLGLGALALLAARRRRNA